LFYASNDNDTIAISAAAMANQFYTTEDLGPNQSLTPEGFLLCKDVPVARTGVMVYGPYELQDENGELLEPSSDGVIYVSRDEDEIFNPRTIASFEGKPVTINHPATITQLVDASNWRDIASGTLQNVRRGKDDKSHLLLGDMLITAQDAINLVRSHQLRQVSLGYVASYVQSEPGHAVQKDILGNHVAIVPQGRCGSTCAIGDTEMNVIEDKRKAALRHAFNTRDAQGFAKALDAWEEKDEEEPEYGKKEPPKESNGGNGGGSGTHHHVEVHVHGSGGGNGGYDKTVTSDPSDQTTGSGPNGGATREGVNPQDSDDMNGNGNGDPVEMIMAAIKKLDQRLSAIEQSVGGSGGGRMGNFPNRDQRTHDELESPPNANSAGEPGDNPKPPETETKMTPHEEKPSSDEGEVLAGKEITPPAEGHMPPTAEGPEGAPPPELKENEDVRATADIAYVQNPMDATRRREQWTDTLARAEMLVPGMRLPTFDAALSEKQIAATLCTFKRKTLAASFETDSGNQAIRGFVTSDSPNFASMTCDAVGVLFTAASERMRERNNILSVSRGPALFAKTGARPKTPAEINAFNRDYWSKRERGA
jgi:hypothetical protein